ncbi:MAG: hypothetical protein ACI9Y7_002001, partial [Dokdonia sp.]
LEAWLSAALFTVALPEYNKSVAINSNLRSKRLSGEISL